MKGSLVIVSFFVIGVLIGYFGLLPFSVVDNNLAFYALCGLMFFVGISLGNDATTLEHIKGLHPKFYLLPLATIVGTLLGCAAVRLLLPSRSLLDVMAVGSGLGYYSLSSIFITECKGAELGTVALLSNIMREVAALLLAPLLVRYFGKLAPIPVGGATTMDTTFPVIVKFSGKEFAIIAVFHGFVLDVSVPVLVTLFCL